MKIAVMTAAIILLFAATSVAETQSPDGGVPDSYIIGPEDVLEINVWKEDELTRQVLVRSDGKISLPLIGDVQAAGLTPVQLKEVITERLQDYMSEPVVSVIVEIPRDIKVYVIGNVKNPGNFSMKHEINLLQAIALAGGLNEWASKKIIVISKEGGKETRRVVNYKEVIAGEALDQNLVLKSGDTIIVP